jgi:flagellar basal body-associated protein FliL
MERLDEEIKGGRSKKIIYISIGAFVALIVLTIILVFALKGSSNDNGGDDNPKIVVDYIYNPYTLN